MWSNGIMVIERANKSDGVGLAKMQEGTGVERDWKRLVVAGGVGDVDRGPVKTFRPVKAWAIT